MSGVSNERKQTIYRLGKFASLLLAAWLVMILTHELGHIVGGICGGGTLVALDLYPWRLPYSIFSPDPNPLVTIWAGPLLGAGAPLIAALLIRREEAWFVANFCLLANGSYIALGWIVGDSHLDAAKLLQAGAYPLSLVVYCGVTIGFGYYGFRKSCIAVLKAN